MQVTETKSEGLRREYKVTMPVSELEQRLTDELSSLKGKVRINGFRPGKVPLSHLRKLYGKSVLVDVVQNAVNEANRKIVADHDLKLALQPKVDLADDQASVENLLALKGDLDFTVAVEVLPSFELTDLSDIEVRKPVAPVSDEDVDAQISRMAAQNRSYTEKDGAAAEGDRVTVDFVGRIDGEVFEGGSAEGIDVDLGSNSFIPGFETQLVGASAGEERKVDVTFPENYGAANLAGKAASFDVTVKKVSGPDELVVDDALAKNFGMEDLAKLKDAVRAALTREGDAQARRKVKKLLLDALDARYAFDLPEGLVEQEFAAVWSQVEADLRSNGRTFADENTTEEEARAEYRKIAERRVRLGLVLAEVGEKADIKVSDEEVDRALVDRVRQYPGQERQAWEFFQKNPNAKAELRAPIFEEKTVDHILGQVKVVEEPISREELFRDDEADGQAGADAPAGTGEK